MIILLMGVYKLVSYLQNNVDTSETDETSITYSNNESNNIEETEFESEAEDSTITYLSDGERIVCIDPGHGGNDCGSSYGSVYEKEQNLDLALALKSALEEKGILVYLTRDEDVWVDKSERVDLANNTHSDLLISLHRNEYADDTSVRGYEAWVNSSKPEDATSLAYLIMEKLEDSGISKNRGVKFGSQTSEEENYYINNHSVGPSVLMEMGFMSNYEDNQFYENNMEEYAGNMADAIEEWMDDQGL